MRRIVKLNETDLNRIVKKVINEQSENDTKSKFEGMSDSSLLKYLKFCKNVLGYTPDELQSFYDDVADNKNISGPVGELSRLDIEYLFFVLHNSNLEVGELVRPDLTEITVTYIVREKIIKTTHRSNDLTTYSEDYIDEGYLESLKTMGDIEPFDWDVDYEDINDEDITDDYFEL